MHFYSLSISVIEDENDGKGPAIDISTYDEIAQEHHDVLMSPEQAIIIAEELKRLAAELM